MSKIWLFFEAYKELIVNGLDLISFTLITPELFRIVSGAAAKRGVSIAIFTAFVLGLTLAGVYFSIWLAFHMDFSNFAYTLLFELALVLFVGLIVNLVVFLLIKALSVGAAWIGAHGLLLGIIVFLVSRLVAFMIAARQVF